MVLRVLTTGAPAALTHSRLLGDNPEVLLPYVQQANAAGRVFDVSVVAFVVGEFSQVWRVRRGATRANLGGEALFRVMFFAGILLPPSVWSWRPAP